MTGVVIPQTPIVVDFWRVRKCPRAQLFFLTHLHADHIVGLTPTWSLPIYCTPVTKKLLVHKLQIRENLIHELSVNCSHTVWLDCEHGETMTVTVIDANHCPGAAIFLFQGYFGNILHTGDFRYSDKMFIDTPLSQSPSVDLLYLDNTYSSPECEFPTRRQAMELIFDILDKHPDHEILVAMRTLGKEDLLVSIALHVNSWVVVSSEQYKLLSILDMPNVFATEVDAGRIHVVPFNKIIPTLHRRNEEHPAIAIIPTALHHGSSNMYRGVQNAFVIPYSDHSSYSELQRFVERVRPKKILPIVSAKSRGPRGEDISKRADMECYKKFMDPGDITPFKIPRSVEAFMKKCRPQVALNRGKKRKQRTVYVEWANKRKVPVARGVEFEEGSDSEHTDNSEAESNASVKTTDPFPLSTKADDWNLIPIHIPEEQRQSAWKTITNPHSHFGNFVQNDGTEKVVRNVRKSIEELNKEESVVCSKESTENEYCSNVIHSSHDVIVSSKEILPPSSPVLNPGERTEVRTPPNEDIDKCNSLQDTQSFCCRIIDSNFTNESSVFQSGLGPEGLSDVQEIAVSDKVISTDPDSESQNTEESMCERKKQYSGVVNSVRENNNKDNQRSPPPHSESREAGYDDQKVTEEKDADELRVVSQGEVNCTVCTTITRQPSAENDAESLSLESPLDEGVLDFLQHEQCLMSDTLPADLGWKEGEGCDSVTVAQNMEQGSGFCRTETLSDLQSVSKDEVAGLACENSYLQGTVGAGHFGVNDNEQRSKRDKSEQLNWTVSNHQLQIPCEALPPTLSNKTVPDITSNHNLPLSVAQEKPQDTADSATLQTLSDIVPYANQQPCTTNLVTANTNDSDHIDIELQSSVGDPTQNTIFTIDINTLNSLLLNQPMPGEHQLTPHSDSTGGENVIFSFDSSMETGTIPSGLPASLMVDAQVAAQGPEAMSHELNQLSSELRDSINEALQNTDHSALTSDVQEDPFCGIHRESERPHSESPELQSISPSTRKRCQRGSMRSQYSVTVKTKAAESAKYFVWGPTSGCSSWQLRGKKRIYDPTRILFEEDVELPGGLALAGTTGHHSEDDAATEPGPKKHGWTKGKARKPQNKDSHFPVNLEEPKNKQFQLVIKLDKIPKGLLSRKKGLEKESEKFQFADKDRQEKHHGAVQAGSTEKSIFELLGEVCPAWSKNRDLGDRVTETEKHSLQTSADGTPISSGLSNINDDLQYEIPNISAGTPNHAQNSTNVAEAYDEVQLLREMQESESIEGTEPILEGDSQLSNAEENVPGASPAIDDDSQRVQGTGVSENRLEERNPTSEFVDEEPQQEGECKSLEEYKCQKTSQEPVLNKYVPQIEKEKITNPENSTEMSESYENSLEVNIRDKTNSATTLNVSVEEIVPPLSADSADDEQQKNTSLDKDEQPLERLSDVESSDIDVRAGQTCVGEEPSQSDDLHTESYSTKRKLDDIQQLATDHLPSKQQTLNTDNIEEDDDDDSEEQGSLDLHSKTNEEETYQEERDLQMNCLQHFPLSQHDVSAPESVTSDDTEGNSPICTSFVQSPAIVNHNELLIQTEKGNANCEVDEESECYRICSTEPATCRASPSSLKSWSSTKYDKEPSVLDCAHQRHSCERLPSNTATHIGVSPSSFNSSSRKPYLSRLSASKIFSASVGKTDCNQNSEDSSDDLVITGEGFEGVQRVENGAKKPRLFKSYSTDDRENPNPASESSRNVDLEEIEIIDASPEDRWSVGNSKGNVYSFCANRHSRPTNLTQRTIRSYFAQNLSPQPSKKKHCSGYRSLSNSTDESLNSKVLRWSGDKSYDIPEETNSYVVSSDTCKRRRYERRTISKRTDLNQPENQNFLSASKPRKVSYLNSYSHSGNNKHDEDGGRSAESRDGVEKGQSLAANQSYIQPREGWKEGRKSLQNHSSSIRERNRFVTHIKVNSTSRRREQCDDVVQDKFIRYPKVNTKGKCDDSVKDKFPEHIKVNARQRTSEGDEKNMLNHLPNNSRIMNHEKDDDEIPNNIVKHSTEVPRAQKWTMGDNRECPPQSRSSGGTSRFLKLLKVKSRTEEYQKTCDKGGCSTSSHEETDQFVKRRRLNPKSPTSGSSVAWKKRRIRIPQNALKGKDAGSKVKDKINVMLTDGQSLDVLGATPRHATQFTAQNL